MTTGTKMRKTSYREVSFYWNDCLECGYCWVSEDIEIKCPKCDSDNLFTTFYTTSGETGDDIQDNSWR